MAQLDRGGEVLIIGGMLKDFRKFILRGNVVDLAVAVVVGAAFTAVVSGFVRDFLTPLIGTLQGKQDFAKNTFTFHNVVFPYGDFLNVFIYFVLTAAVVFFFVVHPVNKLLTLSNRKKETPEPSTVKCPECLAEIPKDARRCMYCTVVVNKTNK